MKVPSGTPQHWIEKVEGINNPQLRGQIASLFYWNMASWEKVLDPAWVPMKEMTTLYNPDVQFPAEELKQVLLGLGVPEWFAKHWTFEGKTVKHNPKGALKKSKPYKRQLGNSSRRVSVFAGLD